MAKTSELGCIPSQKSRSILRSGGRDLRSERFRSVAEQRRAVELAHMIRCKELEPWSRPSCAVSGYRSVLF
jgi:hypothetical protein